MRRFRSILPAAVLLIGVAVLGRDVLFQKRVLSGPDLVNYFIPTAHLAKGWLQQGDLLLWNPMSFCGWPQVGDAQLRWLYPPNLLLLALDPPVAFSLLVMAYIAFAALGMWVYLRQAVGVGPWPALCGAATFGLAGFFACHLMSGIVVFPATGAWVPWILLLGWQIGRPGRNARTIALFAAAIGAQVMSGAPQIVFCTWIALIIQALWRIVVQITQRRGEGKRGLQVLRVPLKCLASYAAGGILGAILGASSLLPVSEFGALSLQRGGKARWEYVTDCSLAPRYLWLTAAPRFFGNPHNERVYWGGQEGYWDVCGYVGIGPLAVLLFGLFAWRSLFAAAGADRRQSPGVAGGADANPDARPLSPCSFAAFHLALAGLALLLAFGRYNPAFKYLYEWVPGFDRFRVPSRWLLFWEFGLATFFALVLERVFAGDTERIAPGRRARVPVVAMFAFLVIAALFSPAFMKAAGITNYVPDFDPAGGRSIDLQWRTMTAGSLWRAALFVLGWLIVLHLGFRRLGAAWRQALPAVAVFLIMVDVLSFGTSMVASRTTQGQVTEFFPRSPLVQFLLGQLDGNRQLALDDVHHFERDQNQPEIWANRAVVAGIHDARGYYPLCLRWFGHFINLMSGRPATYPMGGLLSLDKPPNPNLLSLLNVKFLLSYEKLAIEGVHPSLQTDFGLRIYEVTSRLGPAFLARSHSVAELTDEQEIALLTAPDWNVRESALVSRPPPVDWPSDPTRNPGSILEFSQQTPNRLEVEVERGAGDLLVLSEAYHPGWQATIDDRVAGVVRANHALIGVYVPPGRHSVHLFFRPASFRLGLYLTALGWLILAGLAVNAFGSTGRRRDAGAPSGAR